MYVKYSHLLTIDNTLQNINSTDQLSNIAICTKYTNMNTHKTLKLANHELFLSVVHERKTVVRDILKGRSEF